MRIAMVSEHASPLAAIGGVDAGGQNLHVAALAAGLAGRGHDVRIYTRRDRSAQSGMAEMCPGVMVEHVLAGPTRPMPKDDLLPYMRMFGHWLAERWTGGTWAPDLVHAHYWMSGLAALAARRRWPVPIVLTYHALGSVKRRHQGEQDSSPPTRERYERLLGRQVDRVIAQSRDEVAELALLGVPAGTISLVASGVDLSRFTPEGPTAPRGPMRRLLSVGRLVARKGHEDIIAALRRVPGTESVIVGGPAASQLAGDPVAAQLLRLARRHNVIDRFLLTGAVVPQLMPSWYRSADLTVCTPWYEPFGLTPLEAMACGVPVVAYAVGGITDTVVDGVTGLLVPPRDRDALATALAGLLASPSRMRELSAAAVRRAREHYSWDRTVDQMLAIYRKLADQKPGGCPDRAVLLDPPASAMRRVDDGHQPRVPTSTERVQ
jgi:D-inositol-3-phosphate glycosyltransferase